jgi:polysaccharide export outer membrane protein
MKKIIYLLIFGVLFSSCKVFYPNYLLRETRDFYYYEMAELEHQGHIILPGDFISFSVTPLKGFQLIDAAGAGAGFQPGGLMGNFMFGSAQYFVRPDGYVDLPILGEMYVKGMLRLDLERLLREKYATFFNDPFLTVTISNRRVFLFRGLGRGNVIVLPNENTKLIEVLALAGGITSDSKSHKIRVIRGDYNNPTIKRIDLSTIKGLKDANMIVLSNDIIIVEPITRVVPELLREISPYMSLLTTILSLAILFKR